MCAAYQDLDTDPDALMTQKQEAEAYARLGQKYCIATFSADDAKLPACIEELTAAFTSDYDCGAGP